MKQENRFTCVKKKNTVNKWLTIPREPKDSSICIIRSRPLTTLLILIFSVCTSTDVSVPGDSENVNVISLAVLGKSKYTDWRTHQWKLFFFFSPPTKFNNECTIATIIMINLDFGETIVSSSDSEYSALTSGEWWWSYRWIWKISSRQTGSN